MKIKEVTYNNKYVTGPYLNHQPGFVADLEEGEDPIEALIQLKAIADEFDRRVNNFEDRLVPVVTQEKTITDWSERVDELDKEYESAKAAVSAIEYREDAILWMNNNGWTFNIDLKNIANSKPSKPQ